MKNNILFILSFLLTGCVGYINTSRHHDDMSSVPYNIGIAPYIDLNKYSIADIKKINENRKLVSEYSDGDIHYLEYSAPRAIRPKWLGFGLIVPIYIPKFSPRNDKIRYVFKDGFLTDIDFDYYRDKNKIFPLVPIDCWGEMRPSSPILLYRGGGYEFGQCFNKTEYVNGFFDNSIGCDLPIIRNTNHWNISGLNFTAPFKATRYVVHEIIQTTPTQQQLPQKAYYDYKCKGDNCVKMLCVEGKCEPEAESTSNNIEPTVIETERWYNLSCSYVPALGISGVIYHNDGYVIQIINAPHINRARAIEYINADAYPQMIENINGIKMTIIRQDSESGTTHIAMFFDDNHIYMIRQDTTTDNDGSEFNQLLHTVELDSLNISRN